MGKAALDTNVADEVDGLREAIKQRITKLSSEPSSLSAFTETIIKFFEETMAKGLDLSVITEPSSIIMVQTKEKIKKRRLRHANAN